MKTLLLIRHAKSNWEVFSSDIKREISSIGIKRTTNVGNYLYNYLDRHKIKPQIWLSSTAKRAYQTAEIITRKFNVNFEKEDKLYTFSKNELKRAIHTFDDKYQTVVIFGHNNGFTDFINEFGNKEIFNLPTSGVAIIEFDTNSWNSITKGKIKKIIIPKEIA